MVSRTAFLFPGQGSQSVGMQADLAEQHPIVRDTFAEAVAEFAVAYADQTERDYQALVAAVRKGQIAGNLIREWPEQKVLFLCRFPPGPGQLIHWQRLHGSTRTPVAWPGSDR